MTKTVKLTTHYIKIIKYLAARSSKALNEQNKQYPTISGKMMCHVDRSNLRVPGTGVRNKDIADNPASIPIYNLKTNNSGKKTINMSSVNKTVSAICYELVDENDTIEIPDSIFNEIRHLNSKGAEVGMVEEVINILPKKTAD